MHLYMCELIDIDIHVMINMYIYVGTPIRRRATAP